MASEKTLGLVIRSVEFSDSSRVVTLFTRDFGKLGALAKGAKRLRGPFTGALDLLSLSRIVLIRKRSDVLDLLTAAELEKGFAPQRNCLQALYSGYCVAELLSELTQEDDPHPQLFDCATATLRDLESELPPPLVLRRFELAVLHHTGHAMHLDGCVLCGMGAKQLRPPLFSPSAGGLVCTSCGAALSDKMPLLPGTARLLALLADPEAGQWRRLRVQQTLMDQMQSVTAAAIRYLTDRPLRTWKFLGDTCS